jgi:hypothetical protein
MPLGEVIAKFLAAKSNRSSAYMDKLNADMRLLQSHFGADRSIDWIMSNEIEDFLDSKKAASRPRNNLRSEIITLFRYAQIRLRALHRDRKTEAEMVLRDQTKSRRNIQSQRISDLFRSIPRNTVPKKLASLVTSVSGAKSPACTPRRERSSNIRSKLARNLTTVSRTECILGDMGAD